MVLVILKKIFFKREVATRVLSLLGFFFFCGISLIFVPRSEARDCASLGASASFESMLHLIPHESLSSLVGSLRDLASFQGHSEHIQGNNPIDSFWQRLAELERHLVGYDASRSAPSFHREAVLQVALCGALERMSWVHLNHSATDLPSGELRSLSFFLLDHRLARFPEVQAELIQGVIRRAQQQGPDGAESIHLLGSWLGQESFFTPRQWNQTLEILLSVLRNAHQSLELRIQAVQSLKKIIFTEAPPLFLFQGLTELALSLVQENHEAQNLDLAGEVWMTLAEMLSVYQSSERRHLNPALEAALLGDLSYPDVPRAWLQGFIRRVLDPLRNYLDPQRSSLNAHLMGSDQFYVATLRLSALLGIHPERSVELALDLLESHPTPGSPLEMGALLVLMEGERQRHLFGSHRTDLNEVHSDYGSSEEPSHRSRRVESLELLSTRENTLKDRIWRAFQQALSHEQISSMLIVDYLEILERDFPFRGVVAPSPVVIETLKSLIEKPSILSDFRIYSRVWYGILRSVLANPSVDSSMKFEFIQIYFQYLRILTTDQSAHLLELLSSCLRLQGAEALFGEQALENILRESLSWVDDLRQRILNSSEPRATFLESLCHTTYLLGALRSRNRDHVATDVIESLVSLGVESSSNPQRPPRLPAPLKAARLWALHASETHRGSGGGLAGSVVSRQGNVQAQIDRDVCGASLERVFPDGSQLGLTSTP